jgi:hypothetical protein
VGVGERMPPSSSATCSIRSGCAEKSNPGVHNFNAKGKATRSGGHRRGSGRAHPCDIVLVYIGIDASLLSLPCPLRTSDCAGGD